MKPRIHSLRPAKVKLQWIVTHTVTLICAQKASIRLMQGPTLLHDHVTFDLQRIDHSYVLQKPEVIPATMRD